MTTISLLITKIRGLINDPVSISQIFSDADINAALENFRIYTEDESLTQVGTLGWQSKWRNWEDVSLVDSYGTTLTAVTENLTQGFWTFATTPTAVLATGWVHDVYAASADLLVLWAGKLSQDVTKFSSDGSSYEFGSERDSKLFLARQYQDRSYGFGSIQSIKVVRDDESD
jgi:hypothetical protein